jgi:hypothetical protein
MDPDNDIYIPLNTFLPPKKVYGLESLEYAVTYLCGPRYRTLLLQYKDELCSPQNDTFNLFFRVVSTTLQLDMTYRNYAAKYDQNFWITIRVLKDNLNKFDYKNYRGYLPTDICLINKHYHYFFALLNYGFSVNPSRDGWIYENTDDSMLSFLNSDRLKIVLNSDHSVGNKLLSIIGKCFLSGQDIEHPIICDDGNIYEYRIFIKYIAENGYMSPITLTCISRYIYHILEDRFEKLELKY